MLEFVNTLRKLREEIEKLEREKASLFEEMKGLKAKGEEKVNKLRDEVETLRKEVAALKEVISANTLRKLPASIERTPQRRRYYRRR